MEFEPTSNRPKRGRAKLAVCDRAGGRCCAWLWSWFALNVVLGQAPADAALRVGVIGDSLSAEYDALPEIPGVEDPTEYAAVSVPGWESRCWVEVLGQARAGVLDFGSQKWNLPGWGDYRFTGYQYNFAIPGFEASQYADIVNSSLFSDPQYWPFRLTLGDLLQHEADVAVVWIGGNEFRANYGSLYNGADSAPLVKRLRRDIGDILDFVVGQRSTLQVLVVNLPDLGVTPSKQTDHPDPAKRALVTQATVLANDAIGAEAMSRGLPVADIFAVTRRLIEGETLWFGPVDMRPGSDPDNNPRYAFTREGLHPNSGLQIEISRIIVSSLNEHFCTGIPPITDGEALALLGINPLQPYFDWIADHQLSQSGIGDDPDRDGQANLVEFAFGQDPDQPNASLVALDANFTPPRLSYRPDSARSRLVSVTPQWTTNLTTWDDVPASQITNVNGQFLVQLPPTFNVAFLRLRVAVRPVE